MACSLLAHRPPPHRRDGRCELVCKSMRVSLHRPCSTPSHLVVRRLPSRTRARRKRERRAGGSTKTRQGQAVRCRLRSRPAPARQVAQARVSCKSRGTWYFEEYPPAQARPERGPSAPWRSTPHAAAAQTGPGAATAALAGRRHTCRPCRPSRPRGPGFSPPCTGPRLRPPGRQATARPRLACAGGAAHRQPATQPPFCASARAAPGSPRVQRTARVQRQSPPAPRLPPPPPPPWALCKHASCHLARHRVPSREGARAREWGGGTGLAPVRGGLPRPAQPQQQASSRQRPNRHTAGRELDGSPVLQGWRPSPQRRERREHNEGARPAAAAPA
jgi:hypothetical protein